MQSYKLFAVVSTCWAFSVEIWRWSNYSRLHHAQPACVRLDLEGFSERCTCARKHVFKDLTLTVIACHSVSIIAIKLRKPVSILCPYPANGGMSLMLMAFQIFFPLITTTTTAIIIIIIINIVIIIIDVIFVAAVVIRCFCNFYMYVSKVPLIYLISNLKIVLHTGFINPRDPEQD